ncbi:hypothetical protein, partial [Klebsiella pneumoniae]|uniref:hypothetical protein n=1 Tax=Klebsiella pneumoniae TaxID=573 RepID=UPI003B5C5692
GNIVNQVHMNVQGNLSLSLTVPAKHCSWFKTQSLIRRVKYGILQYRSVMVKAKNKQKTGTFETAKNTSGNFKI